MLKNKEALISQLVKILLSTVVLFFFITASGIATVRLWLAPEVIRSLNNPDQLGRVVARFDLLKDFNLEIKDASITWDKWLFPKLDIKNLKLSNTEGFVFSTLIMDELTLRIGPASIISMLSGDVAFDEIILKSLQLVVGEEIRSLDKKKNIEGNLDKASKVFISFLHHAKLLKVEKTKIKTQFLRTSDETDTLSLGLIKFENDNNKNKPKIILNKINNINLFDLMNKLNFAFAANQNFRIKGVWESIKIEFSENYFKEKNKVNLKTFFENSKILAEYKNLDLRIEKHNFSVNGLDGSFLLKKGLFKVNFKGSEVNIQLKDIFPTGNYYFSEIEGSFVNSDFTFNEIFNEKKDAYVERLFEISKLTLENPEMRLSLKGDLSFKEKQLFTDVVGDIAFKDPQIVSNYLPYKVGPKTREWIKKAFISGDEIPGSIYYKGALYAEKNKVLKKELKFSFSPKDLDLAFSDKWPAIQKLSGELIIEGRTLTLKNVSGEVNGNQISNVSGQIADMKKDPTLKLTGVVSGPTQNMIDYSNNSPIKDWLKGLTDGMSARGTGDINLFLTLNLKNLKESEVFGKLSFKKNQVTLRTYLPILKVVQGDIIFSKKKLVALEIEGESLGEYFKASKISDTNTGSSNIHLEGLFDADHLLSWGLGKEKLVKTEYVEGKAKYKLDIEYSRTGFFVTGASDLVGVEIRVPGVFEKQITDKKNISLNFQRETADYYENQQSMLAIEVPQEKFTFLNKIISERPIGGKKFSPTQSYYNLEIGKSNTGSWKEEGYESEWKGSRNLIDINGDDINLVDYFNFFSFILNNTGSNFLNVVSDVKETKIKLGATKITWNDNVIENFEGLFYSDHSGWSGDLTSDQTNGSIIWFRDTNSVDINLNQLKIINEKPNDFSKVEKKFEFKSLSKLSKKDFNITVTAENFENKFGVLGNLKLHLLHKPKNNIWKIEELSLSSDDFSFYSTGFWKKPGNLDYFSRYDEDGNVHASNKTVTEINFRLESENIQTLFDKVGFTGLLGKASGILSGQVSWFGTPMDVGLEEIFGALSVDIVGGKFIKAEPGLGRLIGLFNLQSLSKRLKLNFEDVLSEGFSFDRMRGDVRLAGGIAETNNLRVLGTQATVFTEGNVNLIKRTQRIRVLVLPNFNAGLASLGYVLVNPAIGLGSFLAQYIMRDPLRKILAFEYKISGDLLNPEVEKNSLKSFNQKDNKILKQENLRDAN